MSNLKTFYIKWKLDTGSFVFADDSLSYDKHYIVQTMKGSPFGYSVSKSIQWKYGFFYFF